MKSILLIDDDQFVTTLYKATLQREGFAVDTVQSAKEAIAKIYQARPDVIVLDLNMPKVSGVALLKAIRTVPLWMHIPIIIFSTGYIRSMVEEATKLGVDKFLTKAQCPPKMMAAEIKELLDRPSTTSSYLVDDAAAIPENPTTEDLPALLEVFASSKDPVDVHTALLKVYKASLPYISRALEANETSVQGQLGRALKNLIEDLYTHPEHIADSNKQTLSAGLQKLARIDAEAVKPALESEQALKNLLQSLGE